MGSHICPSENPEKIPIAPLKVISFDKLLSGSHIEIVKLVDICKSLGFFYLNLTSAESEMKARAPQLPKSVKENMVLFDNFISGSHWVVLKLLKCLSTGLGLTGAARFENKHRADVPARTTMVLLRYPKQLEEGRGIGHNMHTDIGSLTLLFCESYGLQVLSPETNEWGFIAPKAGHAVINVGDSLRFLSGHKLSSCVHRVLPVTERQEEHRYSIAYFLRPEDNAVYVDSRGRELSAKAWHDEKYQVFREPHEKQEQDMVLTGGMEKSGMLM
ncbi:Oxidoreductase [Lachnellula willkommii]|uniref:Oxidoreductase n=1 Tax=Lachnellula willkommii TaxID=215461 RepID=A0A559M7Z4_9HELO|nr:Oxidoreductase [Lachnellula willkommii]